MLFPQPIYAAVDAATPRVIVFLDNGRQIDVAGVHLAAIPSEILTTVGNPYVFALFRPNLTYFAFH